MKQIFLRICDYADYFYWRVLKLEIRGSSFSFRTGPSDPSTSTGSQSSRLRVLLPKVKVLHKQQETKTVTIPREPCSICARTLLKLSRMISAVFCVLRTMLQRIYIQSKSMVSPRWHGRLLVIKVRPIYRCVNRFSCAHFLLKNVVSYTIHSHRTTIHNVNSWYWYDSTLLEITTMSPPKFPYKNVFFSLCDGKYEELAYI